MGNRAAVIFARSDTDFSPPVYLHWNGGPESIVAFLDYMADKGCRMADDPSYAAGRLAQIVANFMGGSLGMGVLQVKGETWQDAAKQAAETGDDNGCFVVLPGNRQSPYTLVKEDGKRVNVTAAHRHKYWEGPNNILAKIAEANDAHFTEKEPA